MKIKCVKSFKHLLIDILVPKFGEFIIIDAIKQKTFF